MDARDASVGSPPSGDFECTKPWNSAAGAGDPRCTGVRIVTRVEAAVVTTGGIGIAHTSTDLLGVTYDVADDADSIGLHVATFQAPTSAAPLAATITSIGLGVESDLGIPAAITAAGTAEAFHLVYVDADAEELLYQQVEGVNATLTSTELVATGIGSGSYTSVAATSDGAVRVAYFVPSTGAVRSALRSTGGGFASPSEVTTGLDMNAPGTGQVSLTFDDQGTPDLLYQQCIVDNFSTPEFVTFDGASWSDAKTIDNNVLNGYAGYSPALVTFGASKYATYYFVAAGQGADATAELHLATWQLETDQPEISILDTSIPANDPGGTDELFRFQAALAIDKYGLLHVAVVRPEVSNASASVEYMRQAVVDGTVKWLTDVVDPDVFAPDINDLSPDAFVAITVDDDARPHIAYRSGADGAVYYATRLDR